MAEELQRCDARADCVTSSVKFPVHHLPSGYVRTRMRTVSPRRQVRAGSHLPISFSYRRSSNKRMQVSSHDSLSKVECACVPLLTIRIIVGCGRSRRQAHRGASSRRSLKDCSRSTSETLCHLAHKYASRRVMLAKRCRAGASHRQPTIRTIGTRTALAKALSLLGRWFAVE